MTRAEYADYEATVAEFFKANGIENLSRTEECEEAYVSSHTCECCGDSQQGMRLDASGYNRERDEILSFVICEDCEYFAEYGRLDDTTMDELDH